MQLVYGGTQTLFRPEKRIIFGPSAIAEKATRVVAKEMTRAEIRGLIQASVLGLSVQK
jgi:2,4-dienoyl-CoA reductase-like NADH-dependent reductase (Old Yellow Enzyme family)